MRMQEALCWLCLLLCAPAVVMSAPADSTQELFYAIEQNGVVSGYAHVIISQTEFGGRRAVQLLDSLWMQMTVLGKSIETTCRFEYRIDPKDGMYFYHTSAIDQGGAKIGGIMEVHGDSMVIMSESRDDTSVVALPPGTIRQNTRMYRHLIDFFVKDTLTQKTCPVFSEVDGTINTVTYTSRGRENLKLAGKTYDALAVESIDRRTGMQVKLWVDAGTGLLLRTSSPARDAYLTDASVKDRLKRPNLDERFLTRVNKVITNPWAISYMKVQARLQPGGLWITPEGLNVPGQKFEGTVKDNRIDGIFEVSHQRYDGANAPPFPCDFSKIDSLRPYLQPADMIESDDSTLIRKAREITAGSKDAWEAATRLSRWVNKEIGPDIPGGITALKTYEMRLGECGSHANLLTAFCRAVGIPARGVFGCMYIPDRGGAFAQHAWNEIFMGTPGWVPVDCTADEVTYADCGHLRVGEWISKATMLNAEKMEILDYQLAAASSAAKDEHTVQIQYGLYVGKYQGERGALTVLIHEGCLGLDIPGRNMIFELKDPDDQGHWFFKLTDAASISFEKDSSGAAVSMTIHERQQLPKKSASDSSAVDLAVPEEYRPLIGAYTVPMQNVSFDVVVLDRQLALRLPGDRTVALGKSETDGQWLGELSRSTTLAISFETNEANQVSAMRFFKLTRCPKIESSASQ